MDALIGMALSATVIALTATPVVRGIALRRGWVDVALSSRKLHGQPMPRLGGVAMVVASYVAVALGCALSGEVLSAVAAEPLQIGALAAAGLAVAGVGVYDDLRGASARQKLSVQFAVAALLWAAGLRLDPIDLGPLGGAVELGWLSLPVTMLWLAGVANAFNLADGLDGLAAGLAVVAALAVMILAGYGGDRLSVLLAAAVVGAVAGFVGYNVHPATIFMGDTGSLFLGMMVGALAIRPYSGSAAGLPVLAVALLVAVPVLDLALACARRAARGMPLFRGDREHLHHKLLDRGLGHWGAVLVLWAVAAALAALGIGLALEPASYAVLLAAAAAIIVGTVAVAGAVRLPEPAAWARRQRNRARMAEIRRVGQRIDRAARLTELSQDLLSAALALGARSVRLRFAPGQPAPRRETARFYLDQARPSVGALEVRWRDGKRDLDRDAEIAIEELCRHVARALGRLRAAAAGPMTAFVDPERRVPRGSRAGEGPGEAPDGPARPARRPPLPPRYA